MKDRDQHALVLERWGAAIESCAAAWKELEIALVKCAALLSEFNEQMKAMNEEELHEVPECESR